MLVRLTPDQTINYWPVIKEVIDEVIKPLGGSKPDIEERMLLGLQSGGLVAWLSARKRLDDVPLITAIVLTTVTEDNWSGARGLVLYAVKAYDTTEAVEWIDGFETLKKHGQHLGCSHMIIMTKEERLSQLSKKFGAVESMFLTIPF